MAHFVSNFVVIATGVNQKSILMTPLNCLTPKIIP